MRHRMSISLALAGLCCVLGGCSDVPAGMAEVSGTVTWNGVPIEAGYINFDPDSGATPQSGKIEQGEFSLLAPVGMNTVRIEANKEVGFVEAMNQPAFKQYIPPQYNFESELSEEVEEGVHNEFQFSLEGQET